MRRLSVVTVKVGLEKRYRKYLVRYDDKYLIDQPVLSWLAEKGETQATIMGIKSLPETASVIGNAKGYPESNSCYVCAVSVNCGVTPRNITMYVWADTFEDAEANLRVFFATEQIESIYRCNITAFIEL